MKKKIKLSANSQMPIVGLGTWQLQGRECREVVRTGLDLGYRHIDTAEAYDNQEEVGRGLRMSGIKREEVFITSKVRKNNLNFDGVRQAITRTLIELGTDWVDLYLIHWPNPEIAIEETLQAMEKIKEEGLIREAGVSNFTIPLLKEALETGVEMVNNQVEYHPSLNQNRLRKFCQKNKIAVTAYSPLAQGADLELEEIKEMALKYGRTPAQIILNWLMSKGMAVIPRSADKKHLTDNLASLEFEMTRTDQKKLENLDKGYSVLR